MEALRPMRLGEILDRTFQMYRERFWLFAASWMPLALAMCGLEIADAYGFHFTKLLRTKNTGEAILWNGVVGLAYFHISSVLSALVMPAVALHVSDALLGRRHSAVEGFVACLRRWYRFLWLGVLRTGLVLVAVELLTVVAMFGVFGIFLALGEKNPRGWDAVLVVSPMFGGIAAFLWIGACLSLAVPACTLEDLSAWTSIQRSWKLSRDSRARVTLTWLSITVASWIAWGTVRWALRWILYFLWSGLHLHLWKPVYPTITYVAYTAFAVFIGPIYPMFVTLIYYDQRIRKEGFDIEWMMQSAGMVESSMAPAQAAESVPEELAPVPVEEAGA